VAPVIHLDTHVLVWVLGGQQARLPPPVRVLLDAERLAISPMVTLELTYLHEIGRVSAPAHEILAELRPTLELVVSTAPFDRVVAHAASMSWTRDPFDRLIVGNALADGASLLTADATIRQHLPSARWADG
jgi:PIN domain nuclease of toxin-antitoxin system